MLGKRQPRLSAHLGGRMLACDTSMKYFESERPQADVRVAEVLALTNSNL